MEKEYSIENLRTVTPQEHLRLRPEMHFEECRKDGHLNSLVIESACHAIDEFIDEKCTFINFHVDGLTFSLHYDAGMSVEADQFGNFKPIGVFSKLMTCSNLKKHLAVGEEFCRLGIAKVQWASESCSVISIHNGKKGSFYFKDGIYESMNLEDAKNEKDSTFFEMKMDSEVFKGLRFNEKEFKERLISLRQKLPGLNCKIF